MQTATVEGHLGKGGIEIKEHNGREFLTLSVASNDRNRKTKEDVTTWWDAIAWINNDGQMKRAQWLVEHGQTGVPCRIFASSFIPELFQGRSGETNLKMKCTLDIFRDVKLWLPKKVGSPTEKSQLGDDDLPF